MRIAPLDHLRHEALSSNPGSVDLQDIQRQQHIRLSTTYPRKAIDRSDGCAGTCADCGPMNLLRWLPHRFTQSTRENPAMCFFIFKQAVNPRSVRSPRASQNTMRSKRNCSRRPPSRLIRSCDRRGTMNLVRWLSRLSTHSTRENPVMSFFIFKRAVSRRSVLVSVGIHNGAWSRQAQSPKRSP